MQFSKECLSNIIQRNADGIVIVGKDGIVHFANPAAEALFEREAEELLGKQFGFPIAAGETTELDIMHRGGETSVAEMRVVETECEEESAYLASFHDITKRKQAEELLKASEGRFKTIFDTAPDGILLADTETKKFHSGNPRICQMLGYSLEEIKNLGVMDIHPEKDLPYVIERFGKQIRGEITLATDIPVQRRDGSVFYADVNSTQLTIAGTSYLMGIFRDITERRQAEKALIASETSYRRLFESARDGILIVNAETGLITDVNLFLQDLLGFSYKEFLGKELWEIGIFKDIAANKANFKELCQKGYIRYENLPLKTADGRQIDVEFVSNVYKADNQKVIQCNIRNITERKNMEAQLIISDRLASIGELASGIAHEINNPLTGIIGFSDLLLDKDIPAEIKEDLKVINREAKRTAQIIKNLLTFARKHSTEREPTDINQSIESVLTMRAYEQRVSNIEVNTHLAPNLPRVFANSFEMQQVFLNIIINAEHFMIEAHGRGALTITTQRVRDSVRASIADDGPGITEDNLRHVFDPFFTTKEVGKGTGLGLSICHGIITKHGGTIHAESESGKGATFIVELPIVWTNRKETPK